jgi:predicted nucleic acid-binding protein
MAATRLARVIAPTAMSTIDGRGTVGAGTTSMSRAKPSYLLIAAAAEQAGLTLLHYDADFDLIAKVTGQACEWVVAAGSID